MPGLRIALLTALSTAWAQQLRGAGRTPAEQSIESVCAGLGIPPRESHQYGFYLGLALARAAETGHVQCLGAILDLDDPPVNIGAVDASGLTALAHATKRGDARPFSLLLPRSDVSCDAWTCHAPLSLGSAQGHVRMVEALLEAGSHVDGLDPDGRTPLQLASLAGQKPVVSRLLLHRSDVGLSAADDRRTALHRAASRGHMEVVDALLAAGANTQALDAWKQTPKDLAQTQGHWHVAGRLEVASMADPRQEPSSGAATSAVREGHDATAGAEDDLELERRKLAMLEERQRHREEA